MKDQAPQTPPPGSAPWGVLVAGNACRASVGALEHPMGSKRWEQYGMETRDTPSSKAQGRREIYAA